jgi:hypothetical protein
MLIYNKLRDIFDTTCQKKAYLHYYYKHFDTLCHLKMKFQ